jgi:hypothetical protein
MSPSSARKLTNDETHSAPAARAATPYDPDSVEQLTALLTAVYRDLNAVRDQPDVVAYYAGFACEIAIFVRAHCGVDLCDPNFPYDDAQALTTALPAVEMWIEDYFGGLSHDAPKFSELDAQAKMQRLATQARMRAACVWKGYLLALNTPPEHWDTDAIYALGSLAILSVADAAKVVAAQRGPDKPDFIRDNARDDEWPPRAFIDLYLQNEDLLTERLRAMPPQA